MTKKIMYVDDETQMLELVKDTFKDSGTEVVLCPGGESCLKELEKGFQGVLLVDVMMPGMNGWELIRAIRDKKLLGGLVICMLTAKGEPDPGLEDIQDCIMDYIRKPVDLEKLRKTVKTLLSLGTAE